MDQSPPNTIKNNENAKKDQSMLWGNPLEVWDTRGIWLLFGGAIVGVFALVISMASAYILYRVADKSQNELKSTSSILSLEIDKQKKLTADADERSAKSNERIAELAVEAETARAQSAAAQNAAARANEQAAKLQQAAAWRVLSPQARAKITEALARIIGWSVEISYPANDPEALFLAAQIGDTFKNANRAVPSALWRITTQPRMYSRGVFFGIRIFGQNEDATNLVRDAFSSIGIPHTSEMIPAVLNDSPGLTIGGTFLTDVTIFVGSKLPPN
jgi:hypothetical protein